MLSLGDGDDGYRVLKQGLSGQRERRCQMEFRRNKKMEFRRIIIRPRAYLVPTPSPSCCPDSYFQGTTSVQSLQKRTATSFAGASGKSRPVAGRGRKHLQHGVRPRLWGGEPEERVFASVARGRVRSAAQRQRTRALSELGCVGPRAPAAHQVHSAGAGFWRGPILRGRARGIHHGTRAPCRDMQRLGRSGSVPCSRRRPRLSCAQVGWASAPAHSGRRRARGAPRRRGHESAARTGAARCD